MMDLGLRHKRRPVFQASPIAGPLRQVERVVS
jgi:hypothetical protein